MKNFIFLVVLGFIFLPSKMEAQEIDNYDQRLTLFAGISNVFQINSGAAFGINVPDKGMAMVETGADTKSFLEGGVPFTRISMRLESLSIKERNGKRILVPAMSATYLRARGAHTNLTVGPRFDLVRDNDGAYVRIGVSPQIGVTRGEEAGTLSGQGLGVIDAFAVCPPLVIGGEGGEYAFKTLRLVLQCSYMVYANQRNMSEPTKPGSFSGMLGVAVSF